MYHLLNPDREDAVVLLLQGMADLVPLGSILFKIILHSSQEEEEDHLYKGRGLFQDLGTIRHTHTKVDRPHKLLLCNLNGGSKGLRCNSKDSQGEGLRCSSSHRSNNNKGLMVSSILLTTNSSNTHLDRVNLNSSRDLAIRQIIPLGTSKAAVW